MKLTCAYWRLPLITVLRVSYAAFNMICDQEHVVFVLKLDVQSQATYFL